MTGASGFIGGHLLPLLESAGHVVLTLARDGLSRAGESVLAVDADSSVDDWALRSMALIR